MNIHITPNPHKNLQLSRTGIYQISELMQVQKIVLELSIPDTPGAASNEGGGAMKRPAGGFRGGSSYLEAKQTTVSM